MFIAPPASKKIIELFEIVSKLVEIVIELVEIKK